MRISQKINKENILRITAMTAAALIIVLMITPDIARCVANGQKSKHLSSLYYINYQLEEVLEEELSTEDYTWHELIGENNSEKLLEEVSEKLFDGKLSAEDYYTENDGYTLKISSVKYPELKTLKMIIPEADNSEF